MINLPWGTAKRPLNAWVNFWLIAGRTDRANGWTIRLGWVWRDRRLAIIDLSPAGAQPMEGRDGTIITLNGEIYNYLELQEELKGAWEFSSDSDTETVLAAYDAFGDQCLDHLRGMFSFALWDHRRNRLFCAEDRFGIKPFYYAVVDRVLYFASEAKALLPFLPEIDTDAGAMGEYLTFNFVIGENTLFKGIKQLLPGHALAVEGDEVRTWRYWDVNYEVDWDHGEDWFQERLRHLLDDSIRVHLRSERACRGLSLGWD